MDIRLEIIQNVTEQLQDRVDQDVLEVIQDVLVVQLQKYEMQERCTELSVVDTSAEGLLKKFIATKRIEGIAESTLKRYVDQNLKMLRFLKKPIYEITTYDLRFYLSFCRQQGKVTNRTLNGMRRCYSSFFSWLSAGGIGREESVRWIGTDKIPRTGEKTVFSGGVGTDSECMQ